MRFIDFSWLFQRLKQAKKMSCLSGHGGVVLRELLERIPLCGHHEATRQEAHTDLLKGLLFHNILKILKKNELNLLNLRALYMTYHIFTCIECFPKGLSRSCRPTTPPERCRPRCESYSGVATGQTPRDKRAPVLGWEKSVLSITSSHIHHHYLSLHHIRWLSYIIIYLYNIVQVVGPRRIDGRWFFRFFSRLLALSWGSGGLKRVSFLGGNVACGEYVRGPCVYRGLSACSLKHRGVSHAGPSC